MLVFYSRYTILCIIKIRFKFHSFAEPYFAMMYEYAFGFPNRQFFYQCFKPEDDIKIKNKQ